MKIAVAADDAGLELKNILSRVLADDPRVTEVHDHGVHVPDDDRPYPPLGIAAAEAVARGEADRALLICGTGIGMCVSANKVPGIRATVAHDAYSVERSVESNNCQVLAMGARVIGPELAKRVVGEWLGHTFDPDSPSAAKVARISAYEQS